jgi:hypothetical protein
MAGFVYLASSNLDTFTNSRIDDMVITTSSNAQNILIGNQSNTTSMITITSNRVGIARSNPAYALDVTGDINFTSSLFNNGALFQTSRWSSNAIGVFISSNVGIHGVPSSCNRMILYGAGGIGLSNFGYTFIAASNSMLGVGTSNPAYTLDVAGSINFTNALFQNGVSFPASRWTSNANGVSIQSNVGIRTAANASNALTVNGNLVMLSNIFPATNALHDLGTSTARFKDLYLSGATRLSGSVALQTDVSLCNLVVTSPLVVQSSTTSKGLEIVRDDLASVGTVLAMSVSGFTQSSNNMIFTLESNTSNYFYTFNSSTAEVLRISGNGNVGISTSNPLYALHVTGTIYSSGDIISFSDSNVKTDLRPIANALDKIDNITGYTFERKDLSMTGKRYAGVLAQDVETVLPEVVYTDYYGNRNVAYGNMVGLLIEGIKELRKENQTLSNLFFSRLIN